jgi:signal transduction histidine kinase
LAQQPPIFVGENCGLLQFSFTPLSQMLDVLTEHVNFTCILATAKQRIDGLTAGTMRFYCSLRETGEFIADQNLIQELILALAENAVQYMDYMKPENRFSVKIEANASSASIYAADNGKGNLPLDQIAPGSAFFNTIKNLVSELKGEITIDATPGIGTAVEITFPANQVPV